MKPFVLTIFACIILMAMASENEVNKYDLGVLGLSFHTQLCTLILYFIHSRTPNDFPLHRKPDSTHRLIIQPIQCESFILFT